MPIAHTPHSAPGRRLASAVAAILAICSLETAFAQGRIGYEIEYPIETGIFLGGEWQCEHNDLQLAGRKHQLDFFEVGNVFGVPPTVASNLWLATMDDPHGAFIAPVDAARWGAVRNKLLNPHNGLGAGLPNVEVPVAAAATTHQCWLRDATLQYADYQRALGLGYDINQLQQFYHREYIDSTIPHSPADFGSQNAFTAAALAGPGYGTRAKNTKGVLEMKSKQPIALVAQDLVDHGNYLRSFLSTAGRCERYCDPQTIQGLSVIARAQRQNECGQNATDLQYVDGLNWVSSNHQINNSHYVFRRDCANPLRPLETQVTLDVRAASLSVDCQTNPPPNTQPAALCTPTPGVGARSQFIRQAFLHAILSAAGVPELYRDLIHDAQISAFITGGGARPAAKQGEMKGYLLMVSYFAFKAGAQKTSFSALPKVKIVELGRAIQASLGETDIVWNAVGGDILRVLQNNQSLQQLNRSGFLNEVSVAFTNPPVLNHAGMPFNGHAGAFGIKNRGGYVEFAIEYRIKDQGQQTLTGAHAHTLHQYMHGVGTGVNGALQPADVQAALADLLQDY